MGPNRGHGHVLAGHILARNGYRTGRPARVGRAFGRSCARFQAGHERVITTVQAKGHRQAMRASGTCMDCWAR